MIRIRSTNPSSLPRWVAVSCLALAFSGGIALPDAMAQPIDLGDAPDPSYPTLLETSGANHLLGSRVYLGACVDGEAEAQPSDGATGDDLDAGSPVWGACEGDDDEDGVVFTSALAIAATADVEVRANDDCILSAWIDWNIDGDWDDAGEELFPGGQVLVAGDNPLSFAVPAAAVTGLTYARFRCTTDGAVPATGPASDGEVEDYEVLVGLAGDYGDAPDPGYPTLAASSGASHLLSSSVYLGACVDSEADGQPAAGADGDDTAPGDPAVGTCPEGDDEDGVVFTSLLLADAAADVEVTAAAACTLSAWIDWSGDGDWDDAGEELFPGGQALAAGVNPLSFAVPAAAVAGETYARFRCTTDGPVSYTGQASDGEVEDYRVPVGSAVDFGDAPAPLYPTLEASDGARHLLGGGVYLGACADVEADGQPTAAADGDDAAAGNPVFGTCAGDGDEDGVVFTSILIPGETADVEVTAAVACTLSAWIDFDGDGNWGDAQDDLFPGGQPLAAGVNSLSYAVPLDAPAGPTIARFRCTTDGPVSYTGQATDGEVEDYQVAISDQDFGDAPDPLYPTLLASDGARHVVGLEDRILLGACSDAEADGQPTAEADGDDLAAGTAYGICDSGDDDDGVTFTSPIFAGGGPGSIDVVTTSPCTLSAWIDWNVDGDWDDPDEDLFPGGQALGIDGTSLGFTVPATVVAGSTYARFRCTTDGAVPPTGSASDGEVEDYQVTIETARDFGDAPAEWGGGTTWFYSTGTAGARHVLGTGVYLGACADAEVDGQPVDRIPGGDDLSASPRVDGTCTAGDDEDGVVFTSALIPGQPANVDVTASAACNLSAWIDWAGDGDWSDPGEYVFANQPLGAGVNNLVIPVPATAVPGTVWTRFRCTTDAFIFYLNEATDGEVEDYALVVGPLADYGDAPDPAYPTLAASSGASHLLGGAVYLGACVDADGDGRPAAAGDGDDLSGGNPFFGTCAGLSDEDGVVFTSALIGGSSADVTVTASAPCTLSAWIDFNRNGEISDPEDALFPGGQLLAAGGNPLSFAVPVGAVGGTTFARFRCTTAGEVTFTGQAPDGEVEDHPVEIVGIDFGDAPDPSYPTLDASSGASHLLGGTYLGACVDADGDGRPSAAADADDLDAGSPIAGSCSHDDDEDGVVFTTALDPGAAAEINVFAATACTLSAWIDFDGDGSWDDAGEELFPGGRALAAGDNVLSVAVPPAAPAGLITYARFRCTTDGPVSFTGQASDGEVEDYRVALGDPIDYGDAPDPAYPTLAASGGASHLLGGGVWLGTCVDADADALPAAAADGDDVGASSPVFGTCSGNDDEDGVAFTSLLSAGAIAEIAVTASQGCTLSAWIDFDGDGAWTGTGEELFPGGQTLTVGPNPLSFPVPATAVAGTTYARFRCTTDGAVAYDGQASDGEVEDYRVTISDLDYGDAPDPSYPTLLASAGARHVLAAESAVFLGGCVDAEADGQPAATADGDDLAIGSPVLISPEAVTCDDDEDGVSFTTPLYAGATAGVAVSANDLCTLSAWIDWNADGDWDDEDEELFAGGEELDAAVNTLHFPIPETAVEGTTYARFRCTTDGAVAYDGLASDGEVEDYQVTVPPAIDYGDAADPDYPTLLASDGARHDLGSGVYLGACVDAEVDGRPSSSADYDDRRSSNLTFGHCVRGDDEDGVVFTSLLLVDETADVEVTATEPCTLSAWIDFDDNGDWDDAHDELFPGGQALDAGTNSLSFAVPAAVAVGPKTARFRCTTDGAVAYDGPASDGEVEDYQVVVGAATDYGDAPDPDYPTLEASSGASHELGGDVWLGACVDGENDGDPSSSARGDDWFAGNPVFGDCAGNDDEDGVVFTSLLAASTTADVEVTASAPCTLSAWIDWDVDGDWDDPDDELFPGGQLLAAGLNPLSFAVPAGVVVGDTYARFRCTTDGAVAPTGQASDGEVEDYKVTIGEVADFGDAPEYYLTRLPEGARHLLGGGVYLGACVDAEADGQPTNQAYGDDENSGNPVFGSCVEGDDEDGVVFTSALVVGTPAEVEVTASAPCTLSAWIDFDGDGSWDGVDEELFPGGEDLVAGVNGLEFAVPAGVAVGTTYARFRCTTDGVVSFTGEASDGEVEDYVVSTEPPEADLSVTKTDSQDPVAPGATLTYTITVANAGSSPAQEVVVTDLLPEEEVTFLATVGCDEDPIGLPECSLGTIDAFAAKQFTLTVVIESPSSGGLITNFARVESATYDPELGNNEVLEETLIDAEPPTVSLVASGGEEIPECGEVLGAVTALQVSFSEPVRDPPDDVDPDDVTNPANYQLVAAGPDHDFATEVCGPVLGDDVAIAIDAVTYDDATQTATLDLGVAEALEESLYRLLVCGSTSIRDLAGNALHGDFPGGEDFLRSYRIERNNLLSNGHFDCSLDGWTAVSTVPEEIGHSVEDFDDSLASGSAQVTNLSASTDFSLEQCAVALSYASCPFTMRVRVDAAPEVVLLLLKTCEYFSEAACSGTSLGSNSDVSFIGDTAGIWELAGLSSRSPDGTVSARCSVDLSTPTGEDFDAYYDEVALSCSAILFADGFESGDTSAWSNTVP